MIGVQLTDKVYFELKLILFLFYKILIYESNDFAKIEDNFFA